MATGRANRWLARVRLPLGGRVVVAVTVLPSGGRVPGGARPAPGVRSAGRGERVRHRAIQRGVRLDALVQVEGRLEVDDLALTDRGHVLERLRLLNQLGGGDVALRQQGR